MLKNYNRIKEIFYWCKMTNYSLFLHRKWRKWKITIPEEKIKQKQLLSLWLETASRRGNQDRSAWSRKRKRKRGISTRGQNDNWRSKIWRIPQNPLILRDRCFKTYLYFLYFYLAIIKRDSAASPRGGYYCLFVELIVVILTLIFDSL